MHRSAWSTINLDWTNLILGFDYSCIQRSWSWHVSFILSYYLVIAWDQAPQSTPRLTSFTDIFPIWPPFLPLSFTAEPCPRLFPMVLCFCRCLWQDLISDAVYSRTGFSLTSLKPKASMKEPFVTKILVDFLFSEISGSEKLQTCSFPWIWWFSGSLLCLTKGPKANQNPSFTWCSDLRVTANQVIFHTFRKKHVASIHD